ncbi:MAG: molybdate ABC transporter substrate-binding protein [Planctomycetes bacterium]|nr:molybdate ABC transporter substrate-binding protein [Planctomycetota bacterium]
MKLLPLSVLFLVGGFLVGCSNAVDDGKIKIFAAASLTDVSSRLDTDANWNLAGSSTLARQIEDGAPCDVYLSANREWVDYLIEKDSASGKPLRFAGNALVVAASENISVKSLADLAKFSRIGIADPSVPAGKYARQWIADTKLTLISLGDVRSVRRAIVSGEVDAGFIYATDARELTTVLTSEISVDYFALIIKDSPQAQAFVKMLTTGVGREMLKRKGFAVDD